MGDDADDIAEVVAETENFTVWKTDEDGEVLYHVELGTLTLHLTEDEWKELVQLTRKK